MAAAVDRAKEWWEGKAPRERRLLAALAATFVICVLGWVGVSVRGGLRAIEAKNQRTRDALIAIEQHRAVQRSSAAAKPPVTIPPAPVPLDSYLDEIITGLSLKSPTYPTPKENQAGVFTELSVRISLQDLTIYQLKDLLERIETKNPVVAVTELHVKRTRRAEDTIDVDLTVTTYYKKPEGGGAPAGDAPAPGQEG